MGPLFLFKNKDLLAIAYIATVSSNCFKCYKAQQSVICAIFHKKYILESKLR